MTERTHIQRFYRQRFAELHTRKLRVNSHRKQMGDWRLRFWFDYDKNLSHYEWLRDGVVAHSYSLPDEPPSDLIDRVVYEWSNQ